ncbi:MAG: ComF family protein [Ruminococcus sp.]|nr:ComF family protein [Ruminococcus sp.]
MNKLFSTLVRIFYPQRCPYCNCVIEHNMIQCEVCAKQMPARYFQNFAKGGYPCYSPFFYQGIFATAVKRFKFHNFSQYASQLAVPLAASIMDMKNDVAFDLVTYVPMHPSRERKRGYNQSKLLAREVSKLIGIECADLLEKVKNNPEQHKCTSSKERKENVKGVFSVVDKQAVKGKNILVIDDILTSGYTLGECCRVLSKAGGRVIQCATLCARNNLPVG